MSRVVLLVAALILYGSLFPWDFHSRKLPDDLFAYMWRGWPARFDRGLIRDVILNVLLYVPLGAAAFLALARRFGFAGGAALALLTGFGLSTGIELLQFFARPRTPSILDILSNGLGTIAGVWLAAGFKPQIERSLGKKGRQTTSPGAFALLVLWSGYQLYPLVPDPSLWRMMERVRRLAEPSWSWMELPAITIEWLAVAFLVEAAFGPRLVRSRYALLLLIIPARLAIVGHGPTAADFFGAAAAVVLAWAMPRSGAMRFRVMAGALVLFLISRELVPFHFERTGARFVWMPFAGYLHGDWPSGLPMLLRKAFDYGIAVWFMRAAGAGLAPAAAAIAGLLIVLEILQLRLPGRVPEITDAVLAAMIGLVLWWLEQDHGRDRAPRKVG